MLCKLYYNEKFDNYSAVLCNFATRNIRVRVVLDKKFAPTPRVEKVEGNFMVTKLLPIRLKSPASSPRAWLIEPITETHVVLEHSGFLTWGSQCWTTAQAAYNMRNVDITPGRLTALLPSTGESYKRIKGWVVLQASALDARLALPRPFGRPVSISGVPDFHDLHTNEGVPA